MALAVLFTPIDTFQPYGEIRLSDQNNKKGFPINNKNGNEESIVDHSINHDSADINIRAYYYR
jgi:hypothetical protein